MESALMISPLKCRPSSIASFDLPVPVAPKTTTTGTFLAAAIMFPIGRDTTLGVFIFRGGHNGANCRCNKKMSSLP